MNEWMDQIVDVPIECSGCHMLTTIGGYADDTTPDLSGDLCDCDAPWRIYVGDAPISAQKKLEAFLDLMQSVDECDTLEREQEMWREQARDDLSE